MLNDYDGSLKSYTNVYYTCFYYLMSETLNKSFQYPHCHVYYLKPDMMMLYVGLIT